MSSSEPSSDSEEGPSTTSRSIKPVSQNPDFRITLSCYELFQGAKQISRSVVYELRRENLQASTYFRARLSLDWAHTSSGEIEIHEAKRKAMNIIFHVLHGRLTSINPYKVTPSTMWCLISTCKTFYPKYKDPGGLLSEWFPRWYDMKLGQSRGVDYNFHERVLFPAYDFDCTKAFQTSSKQLVYGGRGLVSDSCPTKEGLDLFECGLPDCIMDELNFACDTLRTEIAYGLDHFSQALLGFASCACKEQTFWNHHLELRRVGALGPYINQNTIYEIIYSLENFDSRRVEPNTSSEQGCLCHLEGDNNVNKLADRVLNKFDGLCLDCIRTAQSLQGALEPSVRALARQRADVGWDEGCQFRHGHSTFFHSTMAQLFWSFDTLGLFGPSWDRNTARQQFENILGSTQQGGLYFMPWYW